MITNNEPDGSAMDKVGNAMQHMLKRNKRAWITRMKLLARVRLWHPSSDAGLCTRLRPFVGTSCGLSSKAALAQQRTYMDSTPAVELPSLYLPMRGPNITLVAPDAKYDEEMRVIFSDLITMGHLLYLSKSPAGWTMDEIRARRERHEGMMATRTAFIQYIIDNETGKLIGTTGCPTMDPTHNNAYFGIVIHHSYWGKGLATEAHYMSFKYIFETLKLHRLALLTDHDNIKMRSFFEKFGFVFEGYKRENVVWNGVYKDGAEYSVLDREWPAVKEKMEAKMAQKN